MARPTGGSRLRDEPDRTEQGRVWLPLIRRLTEVSPSWVVWKNVDDALAGIGDIDAAAAREDWALIEREFRRWAAENRLGPAFACTHIPGGLNLVAVPESLPAFLEVGVKEQRIFRGSTLFSIGDLGPLAEMDPRGFRRLRAGAEGLLKLVLNGRKWGGRPNRQGLRARRVVELMGQDPEGVREAARLFGPARRAAITAAEAAVRGGWDQRAMLAVELWALLRGPRHPVLMARRVWFRMRTRASCPIVRAILEERRRIPVDRAAWLARVAETHATGPGVREAATATEHPGR
jgi:hypothetical protein